MKPTEEQAEAFKKLWLERFTAGEIVQRFDGQFTRSQVLGKIYRMGLMRNKRPKPMAPIAVRETRKHVIRNGRNGKPRVTPAVRSDGMPYAADRPMPTPSNAAQRSFNEVSGPSYNLGDLNLFDCRWPIGDPQLNGFCYCAAPVVGLGPYCGRHTKIARAPAVRR